MGSNKNKSKNLLDLIINNKSVYLKSLTPYQFFLRDLYIVSSEKTKEWNLAYSCSQELLAFLSFIVTAMAPDNITNQIKRAISSLNVPNEIKNIAFINERIAFYWDVFNGTSHPEPNEPISNSTLKPRSSIIKRDKVFKPTLLGTIADKEFEKEVLSDPLSRTFIAFGSIVFRKNLSPLNRNAAYFKHSFPALFLQFPPFISACISLSGLSNDEDEAETYDSTDEPQSLSSPDPFGELFAVLFMFISKELAAMGIKEEAKIETLSFLYFMFDCMAFQANKDQDHLWKQIAKCVDCVFPGEDHSVLYEQMHDRAMLYAHITNKQIRPNNGYYPPIDDENRHFFKYAWFAYGGILKDPASADYLLEPTAPLWFRPIHETLEFSVLWTSIFQAVVEGIHDSGLFYND